MIIIIGTNIQHCRIEARERGINPHERNLFLLSCESQDAINQLRGRIWTPGSKVYERVIFPMLSSQGLRRYEAIQKEITIMKALRRYGK
jgi:hypothetical protein